MDAKLSYWFLRAGLSKVASNYSQSVCSRIFMVASFLANYDLFADWDSYILTGDMAYEAGISE